MSELHTPWEDPNVKQALADGRMPADISLVCCQRCWNYVYYNDGSHVSCPWCEWSVSGRKLDALLDAGDRLTLDDWDEQQAWSEDVP